MNTCSFGTIISSHSHSPSSCEIHQIQANCAMRHSDKEQKSTLANGGRMSFSKEFEQQNMVMCFLMNTALVVTPSSAA